MPNSDPNEKTLEELIADFVQSEEAGEAADPEAYLSAHPEYARQLAEFFEMHRSMALGKDRAGDAGPSKHAKGGPTRQKSAKSTRRAYASEEAPTLAASTSSHAGESSLASNPPKELGGYEILEEIDRGGMGVVYKARDKQLGRIVALKLIRSGELASEEEVERFLSEAEAAAALTHPGIVPIYEVGRLHGLVFYTMAYIEGESLSDVASRGAMDSLDACRIVHKLCDAVEYAHAAGIYHRDLKPANVLINESGQPIIIDFGLAKIAYRDEGLTATGQILGTPAYLAPEHASGRSKDVGPGGDVYAIGAILYCLTAGQPAFSGPTPFDVLLQVLDRRPPAPSKINKRVDPQIDHVCLRALEKDPADRYASAQELASDLQCILTDEPLDRPQRSFVQRIRNWWQREPILGAHIVGIGVTTTIVAVAHWIRAEESPPFPYRMLLLTTWLVASIFLQYWVHRAHWRMVAILTWLTVDVTIYTSLITFADPPRSMLLIGYPMMVVASGLFYQRRILSTTTVLCILGFLFLGWLFPKDDFVKPDFSAIFVCGLVVISLCVAAFIRRVRGLSRFYEE